MSKKLKKITNALLKASPYALAALIGNMASYAYRITPGDAINEKFDEYAGYFLISLLWFAPSFHRIDLLVGFGTAGALALFVYDRKLNRKKLRTGREHGSAEWGQPKDIEPFADSDNPDNNIILTKTESLAMGDASDPMLNRNKNVFVVGAPGTGKTYYCLEPNLMQMHSSYVVTDSKGGVLKHCGTMLEQNGYVVRVFNTFEFDESMHYNPFAYFNQEKLTDDIAAFIDVLIKNTGEKAPGGDDFWVNAEKLLYTAFISYIFTMYQPADRHIKAVLDLVIMSQTDSEKSAVDIMFDILEMWVDGKEIAVMDGGKCILQLRGVRPFFSNKYDLMKHPNIKATSDYDPKMEFNVEKYLERRRYGYKEDVITSDEQFVNIIDLGEIIDIGDFDADETEDEADEMFNEIFDENETVALTA